MNTIKVAVIGAGLMGERHLSVYKKLNNVEAVSLCDIDKNRALEIAKKYSIPRYTNCMGDLVSDPSIDAISICTPDDLHKEASILSIKNNKHVLIEKPLATNLSDAKEILLAAQDSAVITMVGYSVRFMNPFDQIKASLDTIGIPTFIKIDWFNRGKYSDGQIVPANERDSIITFLATHPIDFIRYLLGDIFSIYCESDNFISKDTDKPDTTSIMLRMKNKCMGHISCSWATTGTPHRVRFSMELIGTEGMIRCSSLDERLLITSNATGYQLPISYDWLPMETKKLEHFIRAIQENKPTIVDVKEGYNSLCATLAAVESNAKKIPVFL